MSEVPSPAPSGADPGPARPDLNIDGLAKLPWHTALYQTWRVQEKDLEEAREEIKRLKVVVQTLKRRLYEARLRQENWQLRQQGWNRERKELLQRVNGKAPQ